MSMEALIILKMGLHPLERLDGWPPVFALLDTLEVAIHAGGGVSRQEIHRMRVWAIQYRLLPSELHSFYERNASTPIIGQALWAILNGLETPSRVRGQVKRMWIDQEGYELPFSTCPTLP